MLELIRTITILCQVTPVTSNSYDGTKFIQKECILKDEF